MSNDPNNQNFYRALAGLVLLAAAAIILPRQAVGDESVVDCPPDACAEIGNWQFGLSLGLGLRSNPLYDSNDIPLVLLPRVSYYGERFFLENLEAGWTLADTGPWMINALVTPSYDGVFFNRWDPGNIFTDIVTDSSAVEGSIDNAGDDADSGTENSAPDGADSETQIDPEELSKRRFSYLAGLDFSWQMRNGTVQAMFLSEISGRNSGKEVRLAYQQRLSPVFSLTGGFSWKDQKLTDYYYGVDKNEVVDDRGVYRPSASLNPFVRLSAKTPGRKNPWRLSVEWQQLDREISQSPIVDEDRIVTFFFGRQFEF